MLNKLKQTFIKLLRTAIDRIIHDLEH